jgi:hypothetical protein
MKTCRVCGTPHPDDVETGHHADSCTCGLSLCQATGPEGCIWTRIVYLPPGLSRAEAQLAALAKQGELIAEWEQSQGRALSPDDAKLLEILKGVKGVK